MNGQKGSIGITALIMVLIGAIFTVAVVPNLTNMPSDWNTSTLITELLRRGGNVIYADTPGDITIDGDLYTRSILPTLNATYDLGSPSMFFDSAYIDHLYAASISTGPILFENIIPTANNTYTVGNASTVFTDIYGISAHFANFNGKVLPSGDIVGTSDTQILTNKILTAPGMSDPIITGNTNTADIIPTLNNTYSIGADTSVYTNFYGVNGYFANINGHAIPVSDFVGISDTQTLTNKTLTSPDMTNADLTGSTDVETVLPSANISYDLGAANLLYNNVYGLNGSFVTLNGGTLPTSNFVGINDVQTLANKTLNSPTLTGNVVGDILPSANITYNLGSASEMYANGYFNDMIANYVVAGNVQSGHVLPSINNTYNVGSPLLYYSNGYFDSLNVNNFTPLSFAGNIIPSINATYDIGSSTNKWNDVYITGAVNIGDATPISPTSDGGLFASRSIRTDEQLSSKAVPWGAGLWVNDTGEGNSLHMSTANYTYTGGAYDKLFSSVGAVFEPEDALLQNRIVLISGSKVGAMTRIMTYIDANNVVIGASTWVEDLTNVAFIVTEPPVLDTADGKMVRINGGDIGYTALYSYNSTAEDILEITATANTTNQHALCVVYDVQGNVQDRAFSIEYETGALPSGGRSLIQVFDVDESGAAATADSSTEIDFIKFNTTNVSAAQKDAIHIGRGFTEALVVEGSTPDDPFYGYYGVAANTTVVNHVTGAPEVGTAYLSSSTANVRLFNANNDYVLIGSNQTFESILAILATNGNSSITPTFQYSSGNGTWAALSTSDATGGFVRSGKISFTAPAGWATTSAIGVGGPTIDTGYYFRVNRTRGPAATTYPVESYFKTFSANSGTDMTIRGDGTIKPPQMLDQIATPDSIYFSLTANALAYKDIAGVVHALY